jgi:hypothetical protein
MHPPGVLDATGLPPVRSAARGGATDVSGLATARACPASGDLRRSGRVSGATRGHTSRVRAGVMATAVLLLAGLDVRAGQAMRDGHPVSGRVRSGDGDLLRLIAEARRQSATFDELARCVEEAHVILYVSLAPNLRAGLNGVLHVPTGREPAPVSYLVAYLRPGRHRVYQVATMAHELAHACEALRAGAGASTRAFELYFATRDPYAVESGPNQVAQRALTEYVRGLRPETARNGRQGSETPADVAALALLTGPDHAHLPAPPKQR